MAEVALRFDTHIREQLESRRSLVASAVPSGEFDVTGQLMRETIDGRPLSDDELVSLNAPLISNRRVTTDNVQLGEHTVAAGGYGTLWLTLSHGQG